MAGVEWKHTNNGVMINFEKKVSLFAIQTKKKIVAKLLIEEIDEQIKISIKSDLFNIVAIDEYPFFSLVKLRQNLELKGYHILVCGSLYNIYPSGMQYNTYSAYELELGKPALRSVDIFDEIDYSEKVATVKYQVSFFEKWIKSLR